MLPAIVLSSRPRKTLVLLTNLRQQLGVSVKSAVHDRHRNHVTVVEISNALKACSQVIDIDIDRLARCMIGNERLDIFQDLVRHHGGNLRLKDIWRAVFRGTFLTRIDVT